MKKRKRVAIKQDFKDADPGRIVVAFKADIPKPDPGRKNDDGRLRYDLIHDEAEAEEVAVLSFGAVKYSPDNWRRVPEAHRRYFAAARRHLAAWRRGERFDSETGLHHLAHALCCVRFLLGLEADADPLLAPTRPARLESALKKLRQTKGL